MRWEQENIRHLQGGKKAIISVARTSSVHFRTILLDKETVCNILVCNSLSETLKSVVIIGYLGAVEFLVPTQERGNERAREHRN